MKKILIAIILINVIFVSGCNRSGSDIYDNSCRQDSDCLSETELRPGCSHYCESDECSEDLRICRAYNKKAGGTFVQCARNEPCKKPVKIECVNNQCEVFGENEEEYTCPEQEGFNCMPIVPEEIAKYCSGPYHEWIKENCDVGFVY